MNTKTKAKNMTGKLPKRIIWIEALRSLEIGDFFKADELSDRRNVANMIVIVKKENTKLEFTTRKLTSREFICVRLDNSPDVCEKIIDGLATGEFVVIYENKFKNLNKEVNAGDSAFQIVGYYQGLKATTLENDKYSEDTEGGWNVVLTETKVPKSALFLYNTDLETTRTQIESLTAA